MSNTANDYRKRIEAVGLHDMKRAIAYGVHQKTERVVMRRITETLGSTGNSLIDRLVLWDHTPEGHIHWEMINLRERRRVL